MKKDRYEIQRLGIAPGHTGIDHRITDKLTDSRVATCYDQENARMVCRALNLLASLIPRQGENGSVDVPFWMVACTEADSARLTTAELLTGPPRFCHESEKLAEAEAVRLAAEHKVYEFAVLKSVAVARWNEAQQRVAWDEME